MRRGPPLRRAHLSLLSLALSTSALSTSALSTSALAAETSWYVVPTPAYDSDDGFGMGVRAELARLDEDHEPYRISWVVHAYLATSGYQHHRLRVDRIGLGSQGRLRLTAHLAWRQWQNDGYWGIGNGTTREPAFVGDFERDDPARTRYRYALRQPFAHLAVRQDLDAEGRWAAYGALNPKHSTVDTYSGSLLDDQLPYGVRGGFALQLLAGGLYDTREPEIAPERGVLVELGGRWAPDLHREAGGFGGVLGVVRGFAPLGGRVVFAGRVMAEWLWGTVPFYEMVHWGGLVPVAGVGGSETLRGVSFGRWRAPAKAVGNAELRLRVLEHGVFGRPVGWEVAPYLDVAAVFDAGDQATADPPEVPLHPAAGLGIRVILDRTFVGRLDVGVGLDPIDDQGQDPTVGVYLVFDHPY